MNIFLTKLTHPFSTYDISWISDLEVELKDHGVNCTEIISSEYRVPQNWKPSTMEMVIQELYEYKLTTRYLRTPPRGGLGLKLHFKMVVHHITEIGAIVLSSKFRRMRQQQGRRNLDISLAYLHFLPFLSEKEHKWILHLEDDAQLLLSANDAAQTIAELLSKLDASSEFVWLADLSKSYSFTELGLSNDFFELIEVGPLQFARITGRASNTFCALLIPTSTWITYLDHLSQSMKTKGLRLIPCDWIFNDFAQKLPVSVLEVTLISEQGIFLQQSLHPA